jgi:hypothetical protein
VERSLQYQITTEGIGNVKKEKSIEFIFSIEVNKHFAILVGNTS